MPARAGSGQLLVKATDDGCWLSMGHSTHAARTAQDERWVPRASGCRYGYAFQRSAGVYTGASQSESRGESMAVTVMEQPAISSEVT